MEGRTAQSPLFIQTVQQDTEFMNIYMFSPGFLSFKEWEIWIPGVWPHSRSLNKGALLLWQTVCMLFYEQDLPYLIATIKHLSYCFCGFPEILVYSLLLPILPFPVSWCQFGHTSLFCFLLLCVRGHGFIFIFADLSK